MNKMHGFDGAAPKTRTIEAFSQSLGLCTRFTSRVRADRMTLMLQLVAVPALVIALYAGQAAATSTQVAPTADMTIEASLPTV